MLVEVLFRASLLVACLVAGAHGEPTILIGEASASTKFSATPSAPIDLTFGIDVPVQPGYRIHFYLPLFRGASNSFGTYGASVVEDPGPGDYEAKQIVPAVPSRNGVQGRNAAGELVESGLRSAYWDAPSETLRVVMGPAAADVTQIFVESKFLRIGANPGGAPNGKGPRPPAAGVKERWWYRVANVRIYTPDACTGTIEGREGFPPEVCPVSEAGSEQLFALASSSKMTSSGSRLFVHPEIGEVGTFAKPYFAYSSITGSATGLNQANCMTVTFIPSFSFMSTPANRAKLQISGLTGTPTEDEDALALYSSRSLCEANSPSMPAGLTGFFQNDVAVPLSNRATWDKDEGKLTMMLQAGRYIEAFQVITFTFKLRNPSEVSDPVVPMIGMEGRTCDKRQFCDRPTSEDITVDAAPFQAAEKVLGAEPNEFKVREIWQSTTDPETALARIHVTLSPNVNIQEETITITNLCVDLSFTEQTLVSNKDNFGSRFNGNLPIEAVSDDDVIIAKAPEWNAATKTLLLNVGTRGLIADKRHSFAILYKTGAEETDGCVPEIAIADKMEKMEMKATDFGKVDLPKFRKFEIGQSTTRPGLTNYICVTLTPNMDLSGATETKITIGGLFGSQAVSGPSRLLRCPRAVTDLSIVRPDVKLLEDSQFVGNNFVFDQDTASAVLTLKSDGLIKKDSEVNFAIPLLNSYEAQDCAQPVLNVSGSWSQNAVFPAASATKRALEGGFEDGDVCAMKVFAPQFTTRAIAQSEPKSGSDNTLTVTVRTNIDMVSEAATGKHPKIVIEALFGAQTEDTTDIQVTGVQGKNFVRLQKAEWTRANGKLELTLAARDAGDENAGQCFAPKTENWETGDYCIKAGYRYVLQFTLKNRVAGQEAPEVIIHGETKMGSDDIVFEPQSMVLPETDHSKPLFILDPGVNDFIRSAKIGQRLPAPAATNAICVTMSVWRDMTGSTAQPTTITIAGLLGFDQDDGKVQMYSSDGLSTLSGLFAGQLSANMAGGVNAADLDMMNWDKEMGQLTASLGNGKGLVGGTDYKFCVQLKNPDASQPCGTPYLVIDSPAGERDTKEFEKDEATAIVDYEAGSACPGLVMTEYFTLASLRHSTNVTSTVSSMMLDIAVNRLLEGLAEDSTTVKLTGLEGFSTVDGGDVVNIMVTKNGLHDTSTFADTADYDGVDTLTLVVQPGAMIQPKVRFPASSIADEDVLMVFFNLKNGNDAQKPMKVFIEASTWAAPKQAVVVGPPVQRVETIVLKPGERFCYSDWLRNENEEKGVTVAFSQIPDGASVELPAGYSFPRSLCFSGSEKPYDEESYPATWQFKQEQVSSTVLDLAITGNDGDSAVDIPLVSSLLRVVPAESVPEWVPEEDARRRRRNLLNACPEGFETRMAIVGSSADATCGCPQSCGLKANCNVRKGGKWTSLLLPEAVCAPPERRPDSNAGAIVGAVLAAFFAILFGTIGYLYTQYPDLFKAPPEEEEEAEEPEDGKPNEKGIEIEPTQVSQESVQPVTYPQPVYQPQMMPIPMQNQPFLDPYGQQYAPYMVPMGSQPPMMSAPMMPMGMNMGSQPPMMQTPMQPSPMAPQGMAPMYQSSYSAPSVPPMMGGGAY